MLGGRRVHCDLCVEVLAAGGEEEILPLQLLYPPLLLLAPLLAHANSNPISVRYLPVGTGTYLLLLIFMKIAVVYGVPEH